MLVALAILIFGVAWLKDYTCSVDARCIACRSRRRGGACAERRGPVNGMRKGEVKGCASSATTSRSTVLAKEIALTTDSRVAIRNVG